MVKLQQLSVRYGAHLALHGVSLALHPGQVLGVVGPNGSGKSSLVKAVAGAVKFEGAVHFGGVAAGRPAIGYMPQDIGATAGLTVLETVLLGRLGHLRWKVQPQDLQAVDRLLGQLGLRPLAGRYLNELSGGQRQMVFLAQALVGEPTVLLLDEPISALDISHQLDVLNTVRALTLERGLCTLIVLHDLNAAMRHTDRVALLSQGELFAFGEPGEVLTEAGIARVFGVSGERLVCGDGSLVWVPVKALRDGPPMLASRGAGTSLAGGNL